LKCWNIHADPLPQRVGVVAQHRLAVEQDVASVGLVKPVERPQQRRYLPDPDGPITAAVVPAGTSMSTPRSTALGPNDR
jgi:hypothetical protein